MDGDRFGHGLGFGRGLGHGHGHEHRGAGSMLGAPTAALLHLDAKLVDAASLRVAAEAEMAETSSSRGWLARVRRQRAESWWMPD